MKVRSSLREPRDRPRLSGVHTAAGRRRRARRHQHAIAQRPGSAGSGLARASARLLERLLQGCAPVPARSPGLPAQLARKPAPPPVLLPQRQQQ